MTRPEDPRRLDRGWDKAPPRPSLGIQTPNVGIETNPSFGQTNVCVRTDICLPDHIPTQIQTGNDRRFNRGTRRTEKESNFNWKWQMIQLWYS